MTPRHPLWPKALLRLIMLPLTVVAMLAACADAALAAPAQVSPTDASINFGNETLRYKVMFKWGMINKVAGRATLTLTGNADSYKAVLYARSEPWADRIYMLRDTLSSTMERRTLVPLHYKRVAHEGGKYTCDELTFSRVRNSFSAKCIRTRLKKDTNEPISTTTQLEAEGMTVDFISAFYYLRSLNFEQMLPGTSVTINIFSGKRKELLRFSIKGIEHINSESDGKRHLAYKVEFRFTSDGKKETSDPIVAWISADSRRVPLQIEGKLKVGKIRCILE